MSDSTLLAGPNYPIPNEHSLASWTGLRKNNLLSQALQDQLLGMEAKASELLGSETGNGSPHPSALEAIDVLPKDRNSVAGGPSVAAMLEVASALEAKLEVQLCH